MMMKTLPTLIISLFTITAVPALASTCYKSSAVKVTDQRTKTPVATTATLTVLWPDRADQIGELIIRAGKVEAIADLSCTTGQPGRCQLGGDSGQITLLNQGDDVKLIAHDGRLGILNDDAQDPTAAVIKGASDEYVLTRLSPDQCRRLFGVREPIVVFPK